MVDDPSHEMDVSAAPITFRATTLNNAGVFQIPQVKLEEVPVHFSEVEQLAWGPIGLSEQVN